MQLANVIGYATATVKHPALNGWKMLLAQPLQADGSEDGEPLLAIDPFGSDRGDRVILSSDGKSVRQAMGTDQTPVRWMIVAVVDE